MNAAKVVRGGTTSSISATENSAGAVMPAAWFTPSRYAAVSHTRSAASRWTARYCASSRYGPPTATSVPFRQSARNATSGSTAATGPTCASTRAAAAIVMPPPWLPPVRAMRSGSIPGSVRTASTSRTASV